MGQISTGSSSRSRPGRVSEPIQSGPAPASADSRKLPRSALADLPGRGIGSVAIGGPHARAITRTRPAPRSPLRFGRVPLVGHHRGLFERGRIGPIRRARDLCHRFLQFRTLRLRAHDHVQQHHVHLHQRPPGGNRGSSLPHRDARLRVAARRGAARLHVRRGELHVDRRGHDQLRCGRLLHLQRGRAADRWRQLAP